MPNVQYIKAVYYWLKHIVRNLIRFKKHFELYDEITELFPVIMIRNCFIRDADITVATAWPTAFDVQRLNNKKGVKYYFIQGYEMWCADNTMVEQSYHLDLKLITISPWLSEIMNNNFNRKIEAEINNGIRLDKFFPAEEKPEKPVRILMLYSDLKCKGADVGLKVLKRIKNSFPEVEVLLFGLMKAPQIDFEIKYFQNPSYKELLSLYQSAHIFLFPSLGEGWGMTPIEAMACKCAVVGTLIGSIKDIYNGKNVEIIEPANINSAFNGLQKAITNKELRGKIAEEGYRSVLGRYDWKKSAQKMEKVFFNSFNP